MNNITTSTTHQKVTNLHYLKTVADNDLVFIKKMIESFVTQTPVMITQMQKHLKASQWKEIGQLAHKMRPLLTFMGLNEMKELTEQLELSCIEQKKLDHIPQAIEKLSKTCQKAYQELAEDLDKNEI